MYKEVIDKIWGIVSDGKFFQHFLFLYGDSGKLFKMNEGKEWDVSVPSP